MAILNALGWCFLIFIKSTMAGTIYSVVDYKAVGDGTTDDSKAFLTAWNAICADANSPSFVIPSGKKFLIREALFQGPCKSAVEFQMAGDIVAPNSLWTTKPTKLITFNLVGLLQKSCFEGGSNINVRQIHLMNSPNKHMSFDGCDTVNIDSITVTAPGDSPNTDGIYLQFCTTVNITQSIIGTGDDCIAIGAGSSNVKVDDITCGPGHGISIGSLGKDGSNAEVDQIHVSNCNIFQALTGARIKTWQGGMGTAKDITFEHINMTEVHTPIVIDQSYTNAPANDVAISQVTFNDIHGTSTEEIAIDVDCSSSVPCRGLVFENINLSKVGGGNVTSSCKNAYGTLSGTIIPTIPLLGP